MTIKPKNTKSLHCLTIPEDWDLMKVSEFGDVYTGNTPSTDDPLNYGSEYLFVSPADLGERKYITNTEKKLSRKGFSISRKFPKGSVLFTCIGSTIGKSGIASEDLTSNQQINAIIVDKENSNEFLYYQLNANAERIKLLAGAQAVPILNKSQFETVKLLRAPLSEQKAIANVLSTWDKAIAQTRQLIVQLRERNKGLEQQLLSGKKRLKPYEKQNWQRLHANEIFKNVSIKNNGTTPLLSATQEKGMIPRDMLEGRVTMPSGDTSTFKLVEKGDFVISLRSFQGGIEYSEYTGLVSPAYTVLKPVLPINDLFFKFYFKSYEFIGHLAVAVIGIRDGKQISYDDFSFLKLPYPSIEEQNAIATILRDALQELIFYEQHVDYLQEQKKGLMQKLLTGEIRVI